MNEQHWIGGGWKKGGSLFAVVNPSDVGDIIGRFHCGDESQVVDAATVARESQGAWAALGLEGRANILDSIGRKMQAMAGELGDMISRDSGKPLAEGVGEAARGGQFFRYYAAEVFRLQGEFAESVRPGVEVFVNREPVGVVGIISPWNFPLATASWKIAPALAFGNSIVWKPSSVAPAVANLFAAITKECELPAGVLNILHGDCGAALTTCEYINAVSFTGSTEVGKKIAAVCASRFAKFQLEMSGKNALVIMDDADLEIAAGAALVGGYSFCGQKCTASGRLIVHKKVHSLFVKKLTALLQKQKVGDARDSQTTMGPVISAQKLTENLNHIARAKKEGCEKVFGGEQLHLNPEGYYMSPALFINGRADIATNREELFAPIACTIVADDYEHALALSNDCDYGLAAGIITNSLSRASHFRRHSQTGCVMINLPTAGTDYHVPFGGVKKSSFGPREQGRYAAEFFTHVKTAYSRAGAP